MPLSSHLATLAAATGAVAFLAGCAGPAGTAPSSNNSIVPNAGAGFAARAENADRAVAFISDSNNDVVDIVSRQEAVSTIQVFGPEGVAVDASHNLYVVEAAGSHVLVYKPPYNGKPTVLSDAGVQPVGVAVDRNGNVAVTSVGSPSGGPGGVVFYAKGASSPTNAIAANGQFAGDYYCAFDAHGNLYLDSKNGSGPFEAGEVVGGVTGTAVTPLTTGNLIQYPGGLQVTAKGEIAILDQAGGSEGPTIYTYNPPSSDSLGSPVKTTRLSNGNDAVAFAFDDEHDRAVLTADTLFTSDQAKRVKPDHEDQIGQLQSFKYPAGGSATNSVRLAYDATIAGVATNRTQTP